MGNGLKKILFLSGGDTHGAYEWLYRMAKASFNAGHEVILLVRKKNKHDSFIKEIVIKKHRKSYFNRFANLCLKKINKNNHEFTTNHKYYFLPGEDETKIICSSSEILASINFRPDIIISGMTDNFVITKTLLELKIQTNATVYQAMADMSFLTGGCHFVWDCEGFKKNCDNCPAIENNFFTSFPKKNLEIKKNNIENGSFGLIVANGWTLAQANQSTIYKNRTKLICNICLDVEEFTDRNRGNAKSIFNIPQNGKVIFAGASNSTAEVKGRKYFLDAIQILQDSIEENQVENIYILMAGGQKNENDTLSNISFKKIHLDYIKDYRLLSLVYQASDVFVCPSLEDGGPMMTAEALACGTPVVGFETGLMFDDSIIKDGFNGYRIKMKDSSSMAKKIAQIINLSDIEHKKISNNSRETALKYLSQSFFLSQLKELSS